LQQPWYNWNIVESGIKNPNPYCNIKLLTYLFLDRTSLTNFYIPNN
jgi:hypothetical protein